MANGFPVWRMGQMQRTDPARGSSQRPGATMGNVQRPQPAQPVPAAIPTPEPEPPREVHREEKKEPPRGAGLPILPEGFKLDRDTLLLLALAWLLWQEQADKRLILALIYILL